MSSPAIASTSTQPGTSSTNDEKKKPLPRWVPVSLAVTTAALPLPIYLLKLHRASLAELAPPARRTAKAAGRLQPARIRPVEPNPRAAEVPADGFNAPLQGLETSGLATPGVTTCAAAVVWGGQSVPWGSGCTCRVQSTAGGLPLPAATQAHPYGLLILVHAQTRESADYMRQTLFCLPGPAARLHRLPDADADHDSDSSPSAPLSPLSQAEHATGEAWTCAAAEVRLRAAYEQRGFAGWADAALREVEEEARVEREKRGLRGSTYYEKRRGGDSSAGWAGMTWLSSSATYATSTTWVAMSCPVPPLLSVRV
ncbi:hypothetical protein GLOTRDRAFT_94947 [Gloeophyllum trabeum ATCC 11539]|uniref:Uncharacterized protein n=1 Tax=Gloeophyllum trabeum (strain ATCC 11539 / FP-39264 / Madison 617) TaxID=670483 RepID=S7Q2L9_GLOTA|nr:uncharacterized protein GLOTRDRAFT_94947 [Gloeophyllum trabeum ATCC 11539]EPQ53797.1 hypothetical protein GLOTRDRAFT_94947 [Gloeophyllum trabeum ATCC 11539]